MDNKQLYETGEVVSKYAANSTRVRSLNNPERDLIDRFDVKNKEVLVIGSGAGRVPVNLLIYGNKVTGIDRSEKLNEAANKNFPRSKFTDLNLQLGDAVNLSNIPDESFDVVIFPMNTLDYIDQYSARETAIKEACKKMRKGGLLAFSSHNKLAYIFSPKVRWRDRNFKSLLKPYHYAKENVVGGGVIFKGKPKFIIDTVSFIGNLKFQGFICDNRTKLDRVLSRNISIAQLVFPYILYVFRKND